MPLTIEVNRGLKIGPWSGYFAARFMPLFCLLLLHFYKFLNVYLSKKTQFVDFYYDIHIYNNLYVHTFK